MNFKRKKLKLGAFNGLPAFSRPLVKRMRSEVAIGQQDFHPVELCNLEYVPERGSAIDPHCDNTWVWGERLVTLNLLSSTILTFSSPSQPILIHVPLPQRSLVIVHGLARYDWLHEIRRKHIISRRLAITLREFSREFLAGGKEEEVGRKVMEINNT